MGHRLLEEAPGGSSCSNVRQHAYSLLGFVELVYATAVKDAVSDKILLWIPDSLTIRFQFLLSRAIGAHTKISHEARGTRRGLR